MNLVYLIYLKLFKSYHCLHPKKCAETLKSYMKQTIKKFILLKKVNT